MFEWLNGIVTDGIDLGRNILLLIVIGIICIVLAKTKALIPVVGAVLLGAIVLFGASDTGLTFLQSKIGEETQVAP